jgi:pre-rRNA-processing protein TSR4
MENLNGLRISSLDEEEEVEEFAMDDDDDDDDDDDEEEEEFATLGFVEKPKTRWSLLRHLFPSKAGGVPVLINWNTI